MAQLTTKLKAERIQQKLKQPGVREKLKAERIQQRLAALSGWERSPDGAVLRRAHELPTVRAAGLFAGLVAEIGASAGHHPAIRLDGRRVTLEVGDGDDGLTDLDFDLAELLSLGADAHGEEPAPLPAETGSGRRTDRGAGRPRRRVRDR